MATSKTKPKITKEEKLQQENDFLKNEVDQLKQMMNKILTSQTVNTEKTIESDGVNETADYVDIPPNKFIKVMSLENNELNLSTGGHGKGKVHTFTKFGQVKNIIYSELADIIHNHSSFAESGRFYIMDKDVVRNHSLSEQYKNILTKDKLHNIVNFSKNEMVQFFENASEAQRETIVSLIIDKIKNGEEVDLNKVDALSKVYGKDIDEMAKDNLD